MNGIVSSPRDLEVLQALVWLGGKHSRPIREPWNIYGEEFEDAALYEAVRNNKQAIAAIQTLSTSANPWIAEAAQLALAELQLQRETISP